jgi:mono/diheme cytochrome c family protein
MKLRIATIVSSIHHHAGLDSRPRAGRRTLFKTKCAMCHGDQGQGKPPMAPKIAGTTKSVADVLTKGGEPKAPHIKPMSTLTPDQVAALAAFVKTLK